MSIRTRTPLLALIERVAPSLRYPHLFLVVLVLFLVDLFLPDPIPFVDELMLALLTFILGSWRTRRKPVSTAEGLERAAESIVSPGPGDVEGPRAPQG